MAPNRFQESSTVLKFALGIAALATLLQIIGVSTNYWVYIGNIIGSGVTAHHGLWKICGRAYGIGICSDYDADAVGTSHWMTPVKALSIVGLLGMAGTTVLLFMSVCISGNKTLRGSSAAIASLSGCLILTGVIVFAVNLATAEHLHYSFGLCVTAGVLSIICSVMLCCDVGQTQSPSQSQSGMVYNPAAPAVAYQAPPGYVAQGQTVQVVQYPPGGQMFAHAQYSMNQSVDQKY